MAGAVARMELRGIPLDLSAVEEHTKPLGELVSEYEVRLHDFGVEPGSSASFLSKMESEGLVEHFREGTKLTTKKEVLQRAEDAETHPACRLFRKHRDFRRMIYFLTQLKRLQGVDGRIRCKLDQIESASGRMASRRPNLIGLPAVLRPIIASPDSREQAELDFCQIEIGVGAAWWGDDNLLALYNRDDAYSAVAQELFANILSKEDCRISASEFKVKHAGLRKKTKVILLGLLYGMGAVGLAHRLKCSVEEAASHLERLFESFPKARRGAQLGIEHSISRGYATSVSGFKRFLHDYNNRDRNALRNHPIQSSAMVIFKKALLKVDREFRGTDVWVLLPRHDSILIEYPIEKREAVVERVRALMIEAVKEVFPEMQPRVEAKFGRSWPTERTLFDELVAIRKSRIGHQDSDTLKRPKVN
ncbi:DNA polymerase [Schlesneria sp. T3-172]|uniref:DNA polymerase n=1 Tax=Schlesneria sphaerica TaxID=3373610 RepID=UPI0037C4F575